jgi:hypothetical protein
MAGVRHHVLPRFLLKGFASKIVPRGVKQDEVFAWVYRKGAAKPFEANIIKVGVEKHFYGKEGDLNVDDEITDVEGDFAASVNALRKRDDGYKVTDDRVIEFIVHLTSRTKHLRDSFIDAGEFLADRLFGYFSDYGNWKAWCVEHLKRHPEVMKNALDEAIPKLPLSAYKKAMVRQRIKKMPIERIMEGMDKEQSQYEFMFEFLRLELLKGMQGIAKQGHIKALLKDLVSEPRLEHYRRLHWYLRKSNVPLILGDVGCLFEIEGEDKYKSLAGVSEEIRNVYLPLSSDLMVVGTPSPEAPSIDFAAINEAVTKCSRDFFVCSVSTPETIRLANLLGEESDMITKEEMEQTITEVISEP